nr:hypothetical protein B0A51_01141 [Rachicladosporium sp. CCFEE 5018]
MAPSVTGTTLVPRPQNRHSHHPHVKLQNGAKTGQQNTSSRLDFDFLARKADFPTAAAPTIDRQGYFLASSKTTASDGTDLEKKAVVYFEDVRAANGDVDGNTINDGVYSQEPMRNDIHYVELFKDEPWEGIESGGGNRKQSPSGKSYFHWTILSNRSAEMFKPREPVGIAVDQDRSYRVYKATGTQSLFTRTDGYGNNWVFWPDYYCVDENNLPGYPDDVYLCLTYKNSDSQALGRGVGYYKRGEDADKGADPNNFEWVEGPGTILDTTRGDAWASKLLDQSVLDNFECCIAGNASGTRKNTLVGEATRGVHEGLYVYKDTPPASRQPNATLQDGTDPELQYYLYADYWCAPTEREIDGGPFS